MTGVQESSLQTPEAILKMFLSGGIAGCCAKTTVAPLDRVKILLQAHNQHYKHLGVIATHKHVVKKEGFLGLYKGNGVQMIRIFPYAAIQFVSFEQYKRLLKSVLPQHHHIVKLFSGSLAGLTAVLFTYPLDVIRARLAFQVKGEHVYIGMVDAARTMISMEGGTKALYRGMTPTIIGMAPYAGLSFYGFETLKNLCLERFPNVFGKPCPQNTGGVVLIIPAKLLCGGLAGAFAQTLAYPVDVVRRRQQLYTMLPESHKYDGGLWRTLSVIYQEDGIKRGLFRGLTINYMRVIPMVSVSFCTYETGKQLMGLDTGVDR